MLAQRSRAQTQLEIETSERIAIMEADLGRGGSLVLIKGLLRAPLLGRVPRKVSDIGKRQLKPI